MATKIKPAGKVLIVVLFVGLVFLGLKWYSKAPKEVGESAKVTKTEVAIPDAPEASLSTNASKLTFPSEETASGGNVKILWNMMAWQSQNGAIYANGGPVTTKGSLFEKSGLFVELKRQDDCFQSCADMVKYIQDYKAGKTKDGFFITFMGSGIPSYITGIANQVKDLGPEYQPVAFLTFGKSYGEDQVIGSEEVKRNPQLLKGKVLRGVRMDGDIDLILKFCGDNGIPVNANDKIYVYDALNLSYSKDFLSAVVDYNTDVKETRKIAVNGKTTGKDTTVGYDLVATWTPGDVNAVNGKGGVTIISTKQYASIMPNITITCKKFLNDNRTSVENMIVSLAQAGDQIRSYDDVKRYVSKLSVKVWNEQDADYWYKYYNGVKHNEHTQLGGSMVFNLNDMAKMLGLNGGQDIYKAVYNTFGTIQSKLYPEDLPTYLEYSKAFDKSFTRSVMDNHPELLEGKSLDIKYNDKITEQLASKSWSIEFESGSDNIKPSSLNVLNQILQEVTTSDGLKVGIYGHTDNTGSDEINIPLSKHRADAVVKYLVSKGLESSRFESEGFGSTQPVADNNTASGKAKNRRVQIVLGN